jgi:hypothetical protein
MKDKITISDLWNLDWKKILYNAIGRRETSWGGIDKALVEYRNAGDCLCGAVVDELLRKGFK